MASSEDLRDQRASPKIMGLGADLNTTSGGKPAHHQKTIPTAHLTFVIDCARGKQLSLAAPSGLPQAPGSNLGPVTPPTKTYILFCGNSQLHLTPEALLGGGHLAQARGTLPPCKDTVSSASSPVNTLCRQQAPQAKETPLKTVPVRSSAWRMVMGSLKAFSSCVCGQAY